ncbi:MAG: class I SAM-dependent methyltransferase [Candidatus Omnitrophota bacterium]
MKIGSPEWNDAMYRLHPTPYAGLAGFVEYIRARLICSLAQISAHDTVLEIGCESGGLMAVLPPCHRLVGIDISSVALSHAQTRLKHIHRDAHFIQCDATGSLPFKQGEFSVIICSEMLEHVANPDKVIDAIRKISTTSTRIIISVPNEAPKIQLKKFLWKIGFLQLLMKGIEKDQSEWHLQAFSRAKLLNLLSPKMNILKLHGVFGLHIIVSCKLFKSD